MACRICETRRPRRYCPGVRGDICSICCGTEREVTVTCPFECEFLQDARRHERPAPLDPARIPNQDIRVTDRFLLDHEELLVFLSRTLVESALETPGVVDSDVREALGSLIRTYRTLQSGVYYESRPANPLAGAVYSAVQQALPRFREAEQQQLGMTKTRDAEVLGILAFLERLELDRNNGRRRGRAFIDFLHGLNRPAAGPQPTPSPLIVP